MANDLTPEEAKGKSFLDELLTDVMERPLDALKPQLGDIDTSLRDLRKAVDAASDTIDRGNRDARGSMQALREALGTLETQAASAERASEITAALEILIESQSQVQTALRTSVGNGLTDVKAALAQVHSHQSSDALARQSDSQSLLTELARLEQSLANERESTGQEIASIRLQTRVALAATMIALVALVVLGVLAVITDL